MPCCLLEIASFVCGVVLLVQGRLSLTQTRLVQGTPARAIGILLMLPLFLSQGGEFLCGMVLGMKHALQGKPMQDPREISQEILPITFLIHLVGDGVPLLLALLIAVLNARRVSPWSYEDEEEVDPRHSPEYFRKERRKTSRQRLWDDEDEDWDEDLPPRSGS